MANSKITNLPELTTLEVEDLFPVVDYSTLTTKKITKQNLKEQLGSGGGAAFFVAASTASAALKARADYVCDGTDDQVQIQAAIDALPDDKGGCVELSYGQYNISSPINVDLAKGFTLRGQGWGTILYAVNGLNDYVIKFPQTEGIDIWAIFHDFKIDGNCGSQSAGGGINAKGAIESIFERIWFYKCYDYAIKLTAVNTSPLSYGHHNKVIACHFDEGSQSAGIGQGVYITQNDENFIMFCDFQYMGGSGRGVTGAIQDQSAGLNDFSHNVFVSCKRGIMTQDSSRTKMIGNTFDLVEEHNIVLKGQELLCMGNNFYSPGANNAGNAAPIYIDYYGDNIIVGNNITSHDTNGVTNSLIWDNGTTDVGGDGFTIGGGNIITGNKFLVKGTLSAGVIIRKINAATKINKVTGNIGLGDGVNRIATATSYTALVSDDVIAVTSTASARTISLPAIANVPIGKIYTVKDESGAAGTNNITIDPNSSETIDGASTKVISSNYGSSRFYSNGTQWLTV